MTTGVAEQRATWQSERVTEVVPPFADAPPFRLADLGIPAPAIF